MDIGAFLLQKLYVLPAVIVALSFHEWGHAFAAYRLGDTTARDYGRLTLNPLSHLDPVGFIMLMLAGFGWAKPVPVNPRNFRKLRRDDILVSIAGVTVNLLLAFIFCGVWMALVKYRIGNSALWQIMLNFVSINLSLMVFNLLPIPPLDGSHVLFNLFPRAGMRIRPIMERYGWLILCVLLISGVISTILSFVINPIFNGMISFYSLFI